MRKTKKRILSYLVLLTFVLTNFLGSVGAIPVHAEGDEMNQDYVMEKTMPSEDEQVLDGQAIRGIPELIAKPASEEDIEHLSKLGSSRISLRSLPVLDSGKTFYAYNPESLEYDLIDATLKRIGAHSYIYLENGITGITDVKLDEIVNTFEDIYITNTSVFGTPPDIDNDKRINILLMDIRDNSGGGSYIAGFFDSTNQLPRVNGYNVPSDQSNECEIFYMDVNEGLPDDPSASLNFFGTLAHEFQHMIQYGTYLANYTYYNQMEETWLNEALACLAEYINFNEHPYGQIEYFLSDLLPSGAGLINWEGSLANYGASYMFALYMYEKFGESFISDLAADPEIGIDSIENQLIANGENMNFDELFEKSQVAIAVDDDDPDLPSDAGEFAFDTINIPEIRQPSYNDMENYLPQMWFYPLVPTSENYNATELSIGTRGGTYRSYAGMLDGGFKMDPALNVVFGNDTGSYYIVKPADVGTAAGTYASFTAAPKTVEKIQPDTIGGNIIEFGDIQWAMLIYIATGTPVNNTVTISGTGTPAPDAAPSTPTNVTYEAGYNHVNLTWDPSDYTEGIQGYNVYRNSSLTPLNPSLIQTTSYTDLTVAPNTSYDYEIEAVGLDDLVSLKTDILSVATLAAPDLDAPNPPSISFAGKGSGYITINFTGSDSPDISHYEVITQLDGMEDNAHRYNTPVGSTITLSGLADDVVYTIYAFTCDTGGNYSVASNKLFIKTGTGGGQVTLSTPPTIPASVTATTIKENKVTLQWTASTQAEGILEYNVYRDGVFVGKTAGNTTQFTDSGLVANTGYEYTVEAVGNDAEHLNSEYSDKCEVTTASAPPALTADSTSNNVDTNLEITYADNPTWRNSINAIQVDGVGLNPSDYSTFIAGTITINAGSITTAETHTITVIADGYSNRQVTQAVTVGAISASRSTVAIDQPLALGATRTVTLTAKDQYDNIILGHQFYADVTVIDNDATRNESYTVHSIGYDASASNIFVGSATAANGQTTVQIAVPAAVDAADGVIVQFKTANGGNNVGSSFSSLKNAPALTADTTGNNVDNALQISFTDDAEWRAAITAVKVGSTTLSSPSDYTIGAGLISINQGEIQTAGIHNITINAAGYNNTNVNQTVTVGSINVANSTVSINQPLAVGATSTITLTARDQYNNLKQGHQFYADLSVIDNDAVRNESYTIGSTGYTGSASNITAGSPTNSSGQTTVAITIPATIDAADGMIIQFKTASGGISIGSSFSNLQAPPSLTADVTSNNVDNPLQITFATNAGWESAITAIKADTTTLNASTDYSISAGVITINQGAIRTSGSHTITVYAVGYNNANVTQTVNVGAISAANSVLTIGPALAAGATGEVHLTAKDQYNNLIQGHQFYADITIIDNNPSNNETFTVNGSGYNTTASNVAVGAVTNSSGKTIIYIAVPAVLDIDDGITLQFKTASGSSSVGSAVSCKGAPALTADSTGNNVDNPLQITFSDNPSWRTAITAVKADSTTLLPAQYSKAEGILTLNQGAVTTSGSHTITVIASGYTAATVTQNVYAGAVSAAQSTAYIDQSLAEGASRAITLTARDQYGNPVQGHQFYMDITVVNSSTTTTESYSVAGIPYTASASGITAGAATGITGQTTIGVAAPASMDINDGIWIQFKLASSGSNVGSVIGYAKPVPPPPPSPSRPRSGGGGGGGGGGGAAAPAATAQPGETLVTSGTLTDQINNTTTNTVAINMAGTGSTQTAVIPSDLLSTIDSKDKNITIKTNDVNITFNPEIAGSDIKALPAGTNLKISVNKLDAAAIVNTLPGSTSDNSIGLYKIGGNVFQFEAKLVGKDKTTDLTSFSSDITIAISLKDSDLGTVDAEKLGVYYFNEKSKAWEYVGGKYDPITKSITFKTNHFSYYTVMKYEKSFSDIAGHWAQADIEKLASRHVFTGMAEGQFNPQAKITRAEFIAMLVRTLELKSPNAEPIAFKDIVQDKYYYGEVLTAWKLGITTGDDTGRFRPDDNITREQLAAMIARALTIINKSPALTEAQINEKLNAYTDKDKVSSFAKNAMAIALEKKIINGWKPDLLAPKENATRAEAAVMLRRLLGGL